MLPLVNNMEKAKKLNILKKVTQVQAGMQLEAEHGTKYGKKYDVTGNDPKKTAKIVAVHLKEIPDYYSRLEKMEDNYKKDKNNKEE